MYQAIVFLPLLGAILAGIIAIAGARARSPAKRRLPARRRTSRDSAHHGGPSAHGDAAVIHSSRHEASSHEPAAAGSRIVELITTTLLMVSMILSWIAFVDVGFGHHDARVPVFTWITSGDLKIDWSLRIDS